MSKGDIIISVQPKFVERILAGEKVAELRRRVPRIQPGCKVWIYTTAPDAVISVCVTVDHIVTASPDKLWKSHRKTLGVSIEEFEEYFKESQTGCAIFFAKVEGLNPGVALAEIRSKSKGFHPPQFFKRLDEGSPELQLFRSRLIVESLA
ncbi:MAG: ASCH domain-containing protein [Edaphobacter sp.]